MDQRLVPLLPLVTKPARYTNHEVNAQHKEWSEDRVKMALAFPDIYDVGMGHLGFKILYAIINGRSDALAEPGLCALGGHAEAHGGTGDPLDLPGIGPGSGLL